MTTLSFKQVTEGAETPVKADQETAAVLPTTVVDEKTSETVTNASQLTTTAPQSLGVTTGGASDMEGQIYSSDLKLPRVNLLNGSSDKGLIKAHGMGSFVFNREVKLSNGEAPWEATVLRVKKQYQQNLPFDSKDIPIVFDTPEEVVANGGSLKYSKDDTNCFKEILHLKLAVQRPDDCPEELEGLFSYEFEDHAYGLAAWTLSGGAFFNVGKLILTHRVTLLKEGFYTGRYSFTAEEKSNAKNSWYSPVVKFLGKHSPEAAEFFKGLM